MSRPSGDQLGLKTSSRLGNRISRSISFLGACLSVPAFRCRYWGDNTGRRIVQGPARSTIAALSLAVYCTSWTFFGSVGLATRSGFDFLTIYIGPILVIGLGHVLITRVVRVAKTQNISSIADFVAARYGKSERVAAIVSLIALIGSVPYIALQLKAVSSSLDVFLTAATGTTTPRFPILGDLALIVAAGPGRSSRSHSERATRTRRSIRTA